MDTTPYYPAPGQHLDPHAATTLLPHGLKPKDATVLFVHAHPDDESSSTGATIGALVEQGATVHLLTMTRGELGEVIDPALKHLEISHPQNTDHGNALGNLRTRELAAAVQALGIHRSIFLGQGPSALPGERPFYRDSGMAWGKDGRATANPAAPQDSLTQLPLTPQAAAIAAVIRETHPDIVITYDADGGYGHPDHKRTHEATLAAISQLENTPYAPRLVWGIEGEANPTDQRPQAVITGNLTRKREAMRAHATQITITSDTTFEYSNKVSQTISAIETYRLLWAKAGYKPQTEQTLEPQPAREAPGPINSAITSVALGLIAGFAGTMYHAHILYLGSFWIPWGALLGALTIYFAATWAAIHTEKNWAAALVGATAFLLVGIFATAKTSSMLVYLNPTNPIGIAGTIWALSTLIASTLAIISATRYRHTKA
ncbi:PIG-L family deacetylase [Rothia nasimurium]|uniref:PIG-L family deacetylase n=1 Tax=Rothia nasimurium TaxID=85336 RepID=UPI003B9F3C6A